MIELEGVPELVDPVMVAAFEGWNDAGDAASTAVGHMEREWKGEVFAALDAEDYYDFQVNRPQVWLDGGSRKITWPTTRLAVVRVDDAGGKGKPRDLVLVRGIEPSMRWRSFCNEILGFAHELGVEMVVVLGALLGDTPHSRPVPVTGVTSDPDLARTMNLEESRYEGPTGIVGILQEACTHAGVPAVSLWASVPHYVSQPPNPKATLALLNRLEDLLELNVPLGELQEDARAWQLGVDQLAAEDSEVAEYVQSLEEARDTAELPEASGEAIAKEFERYLRRRDGGASGGNARESGPGSGPGAAPGFGGEAPKRGTGGGRPRPSRRPAKDSPAEPGKGGREGKDGDADSGAQAENAGAEGEAQDEKSARDTGNGGNGRNGGNGNGEGDEAKNRRKRKNAEHSGNAENGENGENGDEGKGPEGGDEGKDAGKSKGNTGAGRTRRTGTTGTGRSGGRTTRSTGSSTRGGGRGGGGQGGGSRTGKSAKDDGKSKDETGDSEPGPSSPEGGKGEDRGDPANGQGGASGKGGSRARKDGGSKDGGKGKDSGKDSGKE